MKKLLPLIAPFRTAKTAINGRKLPGILLLLALVGSTLTSLAQPTFSYAAKDFVLNQAIAPLAPATSGVAAPGYNINSVTLASGFQSTTGVAVNAAGDVFIADGVANTVTKIPFGGGNATAVVVATGFNAPYGIAIDASGALYVADHGNNEIKKFAAGSNTPTIIGSGFSLPYGVAVDAAGNVYVSDQGHALVKKVAAGTGTITTLGTGFTSPTGIAVDGKGNVYVADQSNNSVMEIPVGGGAEIAIGSGYNQPQGIAIDQSGDIFVSDAGNSAVKEVSAGTLAINSIGSGINVPVGIAIANSGYVYAGDNGDGFVREIIPVGGYFATSVPPGLSFSNITGTFSGTPTKISVPTNYTITAYNSSGGSTAQANIQVSALTFYYNTPQNFTVGTAISTVSPVVTGSVAGPAFGASSTALGSGFSAPNALAVDLSGNIYVADQGSNSIKMMPAAGGTPVVKGSGFISPSGVAVDITGNIFVADKGNSVVKKIPIAGGAITVVGTGFTTPVSVATDFLGNVYVADQGSHSVKKISYVDGSTATLGTTFTTLNSIASDGAGNVYVSDAGTKLITKIPAGGGAGVTIGSGFVAPTGVTVDALGDVFVTESAGSVKEIVAGTTTVTTVISGFSTPQGIVIDLYGDLLVADAGNNAIKEVTPIGGYYITPALPNGLTVNTTTGAITGTPTTARPSLNYTASAYNPSGGNSFVLNITVAAGLAPTVIYNSGSPLAYTAGTAITALSPTSNGVAAVGFSATGVAVGSNFTNPRGVAFDYQGNMYVADYTANTVRKFPYNGSSPVTIGSGFNGPTAVAVDQLGDVYIADYGNNAIKKIFSGQTTPIPVGSGFSHPTGIALDAAGNLYIADNGNSVVKELLASTNQVVTIGSGYGAPLSVAVDAAGSVYIGTISIGPIKKIPAGGGAVVSIGSGFDDAYGVAVDGTGNVFIADGSDNAIKEVAFGSTTVTTISTSVSKPSCIALAPANITVPAPSSTLYVADYNNGQVKKFSPVGGYFVDQALPVGLTINNNTGVITGTPTTPIAGQDYLVYAYNSVGNNFNRVNITVGAPAVPTISYATPQVYTVGTAITALSPTATKVAASGYSASPAVLALGESTPEGIAVDASGNVYVASNLASSLSKYAPGNQSPTIVGSGFNLPAGIAIDAAGNIYIADGGNNAVKKMTGGTGTPTTIGSGFLNPAGVAVDAAGNVYVADYGNNAVKKIAAAGGAVTTLGSGFSHPFGIAVDGAGNIYVGDSGNKLVKKMTAAGGTPTVIGSGFLSAYGVAVDHIGNVFVADFTANAIKEIPLSGGTPVTIGTGIMNPYAVALDLSGNVYATDNGNNEAKQIKRVGGYYVNPVLPAGLAINGNSGIISGTPNKASAAKNYTVTGFNTGGLKTAVVNITVNGATLSTDATLSGLALSAGTLAPVFVSSTVNYSASVANTVTSITLTPTTNESHATVKVNGTAVVSGSASGSIALAVGSNVITTVVTAQDGTTTDTYTVTVTRAASSVATLSNLVISPGTLTPVFATGTVNYTASVSNTITSITITPTATNATATIKVNGATVESGLASSPIALSQGANTITTVVTAQDGTTTKTYKVVVTRAAQSSDGTLSNLVLSSGTLQPAFSASNTGYIDIVDNSVSSITVTPTAHNANATITVNGVAVASGAASGSIALAIGSNTINTIVTSQDGTNIITYSVIVTRPPSSDATLSNLAISAGTLTPAFATGTTNYTATVTNATASITVTPTLSNSNASATINGTTVASGTASGPIALAVGTNTITTTVTAQDGSTTKTYTIKVTRASGTLSANANLFALKLSSGTLSPVFASATLGYTASVGNGIASITVTPTTTDPNATVKVNGVTVVSGTASGAVALAVGANVISAVVTAQNGTTTKTYTVTVTRAPSANANLSSIGSSITPLSPAFTAANTSYTISVSNTVASMTVRPVSSDPNATIKVNGTAVVSNTVSGPIALAEGAVTAVNLVVTAQDGTTTKTYTVNVTRAPSSNANLSHLVLSSGALSPAFASATTFYTSSVSNATASITVTPTSVDANATIQVNGTTVASATASGAIPLVVGLNKITVFVTAQDGTTTQSYSVLVTRVASTNANLASMSPSVTPLSPAFAPATTSYTLSVANTVASMTVKPVTSDANATLTVNGTAQASGTVSSPIALAVGANTINVVVTAQDATTTKTYTITVTRAAGPSNSFDADISVTKPTETPVLAEDGIVIHPGLSPNGDGLNDFLQIDNIGQYPDNKLTIMNRNGQMVYEAKGYDNSSKLFDGHSNKNGAMQLPGTYFYQLDYTVNGTAKHKTGFIVLKY